MSKSIGKGTIILILSGLICKLLGAFFRLPLTSILGIEGIGVFQMVMSIYSFALVLTSGGVATALSKFVSQARARGDLAKIKSLVKVALLYSLIFGFLGGLLLFVFATKIAAFQGAISAALSYRLMVLLIPFGGVIAAMRGVFQGYENMTPTAISQILEQVFKFTLGLGISFVLGKKGLEAGVFGAFLGVTAGELAAIIFLSISMHFKAKLVGEKVNHIAFPFFKAALPLSFGAAVLPFVAAVDSLIVVSRLSKAGFSTQIATQLFGLQTGVVGAILNFPLIISTSISVAMLPTISYMEAQLSQDGNKAVAKALKIMWLVLLPIVFGLCSICRPLYGLVYPSLDAAMLDYAVQLTYLGSASVIISALMQFFIALLQAKGKFGYCMSAYILGGLLKIVCVYVLCALPAVNIYGVVVGNIALSGTVCIMALIKNKKKISIGFFDLSLPLLSSIAMTMAIAYFLSSVSLSLILQIVFSVLIGACIYAFLTYPILAESLGEILNKFKSKQNNTSNLE